MVTQDPIAQDLVVGQVYTRQEAHALIGGGDYRSFIAHKNNTLLGLFPHPWHNPSMARGLFAITAGEWPRFEKDVAALLQMLPALPTFHWVGPHQWRYMGYWQPIGVLRRGPIFDDEAALCVAGDPKRAPIAYVIVAEPVAP